MSSRLLRKCDLARQIRDLAPRTPIGAVGDQLDNLVFDGFIAFTRDPWYDQLPRYCRAMLARLGSASANPPRTRRQLSRSTHSWPTSMTCVRPNRPDACPTWWTTSAS